MMMRLYGGPTLADYTARRSYPLMRWAYTGEPQRLLAGCWALKKRVKLFIDSCALILTDLLMSAKR